MADVEHDIERDIAGATAAHDTLVEHLRTLGDIESSTPSRLPDWTVGHVLTHLARNADGHVSMLDGRPQYPHGAEGRNADIEAGAGRRWSELVDEVAATNAALERRWSSVDDWSGSAVTLGGERAISLLPFLRWREVEIHRVDLGLGYEFAAMPPEYVRKELRMLEMLWRARKPMGMTPLPTEALTVSTPDRLAWLTGRLEIDGLAPADIF